eukprot:Tbor_TRINITY_DN5692_c2_g1::TRINITY_DN5692_c2_g1_i5::g.8200::m.8200/K00799/GST, gst; glutathione S-transferase
MSDQCTLAYWGVRGVCASRMALHVAGIPYTNEYPDPDAWRTPETGTKAVYGKVNPLVNLPLLKLPDGKMIAQSNAILRWVGRKMPSLVGETDEERVNVDQAWEHLLDFRKAIHDAVYSKDHQTSKKNLLEESIPRCYSSIEKFSAQVGGSGPFLLGGKVTIPDLILLDLVVVLEVVYSNLDSLSGYPRVLSAYEAVKKLDTLKPHYAEEEKRPLHSGVVSFADIKL